MFRFNLTGRGLSVDFGGWCFLEMVLNCSLLVISLPKWNQRPIGLNCWNLAFKGAYIFCYKKFVYEKFVVKMEPLAAPAENVPTPRSISCFLTSLLISQDSYTGATESHKETSTDTSRLLVYNGRLQWLVLWRWKWDAPAGASRCLLKSTQGHFWRLSFRNSSGVCSHNICHLW